MSVRENGEPLFEKQTRRALPAKNDPEFGAAQTGCVSSAWTSPTPSTDFVARDLLEEIGHAVGAFDERSALVPYLAVELIKRLVRANWQGEIPGWYPSHDTTEHGECSPWCLACRKYRLPPSP
jgi:hypothetical protein